MINIYCGPAIGNVIMQHAGGPGVVGGIADDARLHVLQEQHLPRWRAGGLTAVVMQPAAWSTINILMKEVRESDGEIVFCKSRSDYENLPEGSFGLFLSVEGYMDFAGDFDALYTMAELGVTAFTFTHNTQNLLCTGAGERYGEGGFTHLGKATLKELERVPMLVDLVHTSRASFWDALDIYSGDVFVSHSNSNHVCEHPRNLTDDQIKAVAERGGVIGTNTYRGYVSNKPFEATLSDYIDHAMRTYDLVGPNHMAIGADFYEMKVEMLEETLGGVDPDGSLGLAGDGVTLYAKGPVGLEDASCLGKIATGLAERCLTEDEIKLVTGGAYLNMLGRIRP